ncbi:MAG: hypothetical protein RLZ72_22 [Actinomycetota bacterium]
MRSVPFAAWPAAGLWLVLWFFAPVEPYRAPTAPDWVVGIREHFATSIAHFGGDGATLVPGLVLGDTSAVSTSLTDAMRVASLSHLTAVSGANCAVIVSVIFGLSALAGMTLWWRVGISMVALGVFVAVVGVEPSVIRAAFMAVIALVALGSGRPTAGITALSLATLLSLVIAPSLAHSIGFAMSVAATAGILVLTRPLTEIIGRWIPTRFATVLAIPVAAQISVQPLLLVFAPEISTYAIPANLLADPLAPIATVAGLVGLLLGSIPSLGLPFLWVAWLSSSAIALIARTVTTLPSPTIPWPGGSVGITIAVLCTAFVAWSLVTKRPVPAFIAGVLTLVALSSTIGGRSVAWLSAPNDWTIAQCDVGQGDAVVFRDSGAVMLIDVGREDRPIRDCLAQLRIDHIDVLVLTHFDIDHAGGYRSIVGRVGTVIHGPTDGLADDLTLSDLAGGGAQLVDADRGMNGQLGRYLWSIAWPVHSIPVEPGNPASVIVSLQPGGLCDSTCITFVDLGDLPANEQNHLLSRGGIAKIDVVKVSHHGSADQSPELYARLRADIGLIGVGVDNDYGHPTETALALVAGSGGIAIRSDQRGMALISRAADGSLRVWTERAG